MKKIITFIMITFLAMAFSPFASYTGEMGTTIAHSKDFEKMKDLVGVWNGKGTEMGKEMEQLKVIYELTSAGNAIVERFAAGTPHEMVTVYHDYNGKLTMTHYCSLGNQPHMELRNPGEKNNMTFELSEKAPGLVSLNETHMHTLAIVVNGKESITQTWTLYDKGVKKKDVVVHLVRTNI